MALRIGIVGFGGNAGMHQRYLTSGAFDDCELTAVADIDPARLKAAETMFGDRVKRFDCAEALLDAKVVDAIIVCTPHYDHPTIAIQAFKRGLHVLTEKPAGVFTRQVREMNEAAAASGKVFGIMFNQRTLPLYQKVRELVHSGELGKIIRFNWTITNWFRTQSYYDSGGWRATWAGEGGGVLTNQCPHNLDLWQWILGVPKRIRAFCNVAKHHQIEVEDEATLYAEYEDGAVGVFASSTGEAPGINRLEIAGENGLLIAENTLTFKRNRQSSIAFCNDPKSSRMGRPECWDINVPLPSTPKGHSVITRNWVNAILKGEPLLAPGAEGIHGLQLCNAAYLSSWTDQWVDIPVDEAAFEQHLQEKIKNSTFRKPNRNEVMDFEGTTQT